MRLADLTQPPPAPGVWDWNADGVVILPQFFDDEPLDEYETEWLERFEGPTRGSDGLRVFDTDEGEGWPDVTPYMRYPALRALCCDGQLARTLERLIGEPAAVHLNLTGWVTTGRDWHQDSYLNPAHVGDYYAAVWTALDDIDPRSGPFQYVPGSHRWPQVTQSRIGRLFDLTDPLWPRKTEHLLTPLFAKEIEARRAEVIDYVPARGDVLIWHGRLLHRGSVAQIPGLQRRALIAHYSGINHRQDFPEMARQHELGGFYFPLDVRQPAR
jgi:ectoine hydroxylase-related dioxygenase (phytanoyl-CoA dioxygenase family)